LLGRVFLGLALRHGCPVTLLQSSTATQRIS
jgi:hypothetical protein